MNIVFIHLCKFKYIYISYQLAFFVLSTFFFFRWLVDIYSLSLLLKKSAIENPFSVEHLLGGQC